ncbi:MAG TPA: NAD(P)H-dependent glycerol-3-phosphate dehydrogenase [Mycobacteriales bacterium]|nr:NAD(P)H-dependent glycerol-3-phosphate dehydrogenase [Mycobacteriales bacterium]
MARAAVLGSGSWGTAFAKVLCDADTTTTLWARRAEVASAISDRRENPDYLPGVALPPALRATTDPRDALAGADFVVLAVPSQTLRENLAGWAALIPPDATLVSLMKGVELGTLKRMSEVIAEVADVAPSRVAVVSGPNLAKEIAAEQPAASVVACTDPLRADALADACVTRYFRPYTNDDVIGCEVSGAGKNVIALVCGIAEGMGFGDNTMATLMTRGLVEIARLGVALGAQARTFAGLAGMGDLVATCASPLSRNHSFGQKIGRGMTMDEILAGSHQVAEGVKSCRSILDLARKHDVDMPLTEGVERVLYEGVSPREMVASLMGRARQSEAIPH